MLAPFLVNDGVAPDGAQGMNKKPNVESFARSPHLKRSWGKVPPSILASAFGVERFNLNANVIKLFD